MNQLISTDNSKIFFIYILFITLSIYNHTNFILRPTEIFIPILLLYVFAYFRQAQKIIFFGMIMLVYLFLVELVNSGFSGLAEALGRIRFWAYAIIFLVLAKFFSTFNLVAYKKTILKAIFLSMFLIAIIYAFIYLDISFVKIYFSSYSINEDLLIASGERISGVSTSIIFLFLILVYLLGFEKKVKAGIIVFALIILFFTLSRQNFVTFLALYAVLFFSFRLIIYIIVSMIMFLGVITQSLHWLLNNDNFYTLGVRLAELVYITSSPSFLGRLRDTGFFIENWTGNFWNFIVGNGLSFKLMYPRYYSEFDPFTGSLDVYYNIAYQQYRHNADNIVSLLVVEGGLLLLVFITSMLLYTGLKTYKNDKRLGLVFILLCIITGLSSVHMITNYIIVFTLGFIYFYSFKMKYQTKVLMK